MRQNPLELLGQLVSVSQTEGEGRGGPRSVTHSNNTKLIAAIFRSETRSHNMSHAEASAHCRAAGDLQFRGHALHGLRVVSVTHPHRGRDGERDVFLPPRLSRCVYNCI